MSKGQRHWGEVGRVAVGWGAVDCVSVSKGRRGEVGHVAASGMSSTGLLRYGENVDAIKRSLIEGCSMDAANSRHGESVDVCRRKLIEVALPLSAAVRA